MTGAVEERLRQALAQEAGTTTTSPDGWRRIRSGIDAGGRVRRRPSVPWLVLAPAAAAVVVVAMIAMISGGSGDRTVQVTGDTGRLYLAPTGVEPRFRVTAASDAPSVSPLAPWTYRAFGRRAADGVGVEASVVITLPADRALSGTTPEPASLRAAGRDVPVATDPLGQRILSWTQADGTTVGVMTFGLSPVELTTLTESLLAGQAATAVPALPAGFTDLGRGAESAPLRTTLQTWQAGDGDLFSIAVGEDAGASLGTLAWGLPGSRARDVRGTTAVFLAREETYLAWIERPGIVVVLQARGLSEPELLAIAAGLRPIGDAGWRELTTRAPQLSPPVATGPDIGPPPGLPPRPAAGSNSGDWVPDPNAYFVIVPVRATLPTPCPTMREGVFLTETVAGREVACYQVTAPFLYADDVDTAVAREDRTTGAWAVEYTLTAHGVDRMADLFREIGGGGQFAIVAEGRVVAAPRIEALPGSKGIVTGVDEATARRLAERLSR